MSRMNLGAVLGLCLVLTFACAKPPIGSKIDMQKAATVVNGFDEDHTGILQSPALAQCINRLLARAAARDGKP